MAENHNKKGAPVEATQEEGFVQRNLKKIAYCVLVIIVLLVACLLGKNYFEKQDKKAAEALFPCEQLFQQGNYDKALNGDGQEVLGLLEVAKKYSHTKSGNLAKLYAGLAYAQTEKYEDAEKYLSDFDAKDDEMISPAALAALGNVYVHLGKTEKAIDMLKKAARKADNAVESPIFLVQAAELLESQGKADDALKLYEMVKENYRGSQVGQEIDKYIERVKK